MLGGGGGDEQEHRSREERRGCKRSVERECLKSKTNLLPPPQPPHVSPTLSPQNLIVGGGYHGKSTLLNSLLSGVHYLQPHPSGCLCRTYIKTHPLACGVRSEDGRVIPPLDVRRFVSGLPKGRNGIEVDLTKFKTDNASGSTSMAAGVLEAVEHGAKVRRGLFWILCVWG